jgi:hypothetical protein
MALVGIKPDPRPRARSPSPDGGVRPGPWCVPAADEQRARRQCRGSVRPKRARSFQSTGVPDGPIAVARLLLSGRAALRRAPSATPASRPYLSGARVSSAPRVELLLRPPGCGGAWARVGRIVCVRAPSLTSVRDSRVGSGAGDKMFDGVTLVGEALRPLSLSGPFTRTCRQDDAGSRPRRIGVMKGVLARARDRLDVGCAGHWAGAGCSIAEPKPGSSGQLIRWLGGGGRLEPADAAA